MTEHAQVMRHYDRTRAGYEALWPNTRRSWGIMTDHARGMRHNDRTRAGWGIMTDRTRAGHEALWPTEHARGMKHYYRTQAGQEVLYRTSAGHEALLQNTHGSWGIMTEEGKFVQHCYWNTKHYTYLNTFLSSDVRTYGAYTYPLGNRMSYFSNKLTA